MIVSIHVNSNTFYKVLYLSHKFLAFLLVFAVHCSNQPAAWRQGLQVRTKLDSHHIAETFEEKSQSTPTFCCLNVWIQQMSLLYVCLFQQLLQVNYYQDPHVVPEVAVSLNLNVKINPKRQASQLISKTQHFSAAVWQTKATKRAHVDEVLISESLNLKCCLQKARKDSVTQCCFCIL